MDAWCGALGTQKIIGEGWLRTISPCYVETTSAVVLLLLCVALAVIQNGSSRSWAASLAAQGVVVKPGMLGRETGFLVSSCILVVIHLAFTLTSALVAPGLPFHTAHHAALALVWLIMVGLVECMCGVEWFA